ncbi:MULTISPECIES: ABC transporter permease [Deinococcus]|uniref:ABC transporter permease n=1 Tax=Deinococcus TaxID=1298 RepID=UPI001056C276|nr:ABC transporter permease [Deinococcus sp. S9]MBI0446661.1 ABC transporter permease [Deinococcus sp. DB0503]TDE85875.1 ABC transporter permease [Deinococcus sp. S9]
MLTLVLLEFRKLLGARSARLALLVCLLLPLLWLIAPRLSALLQVALVSGWQLPAVSLGVLVQFLLPLFIAVTCAEMIGAEISQGTLAPLLLRPVDRTRVILSKLAVALLYPALLIVVLVAGSLLAGLGLGLGSFTGGTGLGPGFFVGVGPLSSSEAFLQVLRGSLLAAVMLMPVAALALLFGVLYLNTAAAALATLATLNILRLLVVFPEGIQRLLLTSHFDLYARQDNVLQPLILLLIYTAGFGFLAVYAFERRDV